MTMRPRNEKERMGREPFHPLPDPALPEELIPWDDIEDHPDWVKKTYPTWEAIKNFILIGLGIKK